MAEATATNACETAPGDGLAAELADDRGIRVSRCYQCLKCAAGCPVLDFQDRSPAEMVRLIVWGMDDEALRAETLWVCASCETCATRCPNDIDLMGMMDFLRQKAIERKAVPGTDRALLFHKAFLGDLARGGRIHEISMLGRFKRLTGRYWEDIGLGLRLFLRGKIRLFPRRGGKEGVREIFRKRKDAKKR